MKYDVIEKALQGFIGQCQCLMPGQVKRPVQLCAALVVAGDGQMRQVARMLRRPGNQTSRLQWIRRVLDAPFVACAWVYEPLLESVLKTKSETVWHILMDRTRVAGWEEDVLMLSLSFRKRSLPLVWCRIRSGRASTRTCQQLLQRCQRLIPADVQVIFHGDCEFGNAQLLCWLRHQGWDFIAAQSGQTQFRRTGETDFQRLDTLPVTKKRAVKVERVDLSKQHQLGAINIYAFYQEHNRDSSRKSRRIQYLATSLPLSKLIKVLGKRRWGIECLFRDLKTEGWDLESSRLQPGRRRDSLLMMVAICYLFLSLLGRWLCKSGRRHEIDSHPTRQMSLFHIGWDWLIHQWRCGIQYPHLSTLYF